MLRRLVRRAVTPAATLALAAGLLVSGAGTAQAATPLPPVPSVDLNRYVGVWKEVASIPQIFTLQCLSKTTATYAVVNPSTISVVNRCESLFGIPSTVTGQATVLDPATNAQLRVAFNGVPNFGTTTTPNYVITALAPDYSWAIVGDPGRSSGFVLSRSGVLTKAQWSQVRSTLTQRGYNTCSFFTTPQPGGRLFKLPLCLG